MIPSNLPIDPKKVNMNTSWWGGFVIEHDGFRAYHAGDTAWFEGFSEIGRRCGPIDPKKVISS